MRDESFVCLPRYIGTPPVDHSRLIFGMKEGHVLFNDVLNTFYLRLYGVRHMVKDRSTLYVSLLIRVK